MIFLLLRHAGLDVKAYRYYDSKTCGFDFAGAMDDINVSNRNDEPVCDILLLPDGFNGRITLFEFETGLRYILWGLKYIG